MPVTALSGRAGASLALAASIAVGSVSFTLIKFVLRDVSPLTLAAGRVVFSALTFVVVVGAQSGRRSPIARADRRRVLAVGVAGSVGFHSLFSWGQQRVSVAAAAIVLACMPALVAAGEMAFMGHRLARRQLAGLALCLVGIAFTAGVSGSGGLGSGGGPGVGTSLIGLAAVAGATAMWAIVTLLSRTLADRYDPWWMNTPGTVLGALMIVALAVGRVGDVSLWVRLSMISPVDWAALAWLGAVSSAFMYAAMARAMREFTATTAATLTTLVTPLSAGAAWAALGERPTGATAVGGAVVVVGVLMTVGNIGSAGRVRR